MIKSKYINSCSSQLRYVNHLLSEHNIVVAREIILELLKNQSDNVFFWHLLVESYVINGEYDRAIFLIENSGIKNNKKIIFDLIGIYVKLGMKEKIQELYFEYFDMNSVNMKDFTEVNDMRLLSYLKNIADNDFDVNGRDNIYFRRYFKKIDDYSKTSVVKKINKNYCDCNHKILFRDQDISLLYDMVEEYISKNFDRGFLSLPVYDEYCFHLSNCGICDGNNTDYFRALVLVNTSRIVTMFPVSHSRYCLYHELKENRADDMGKAKVKTGMERFNARYGKSFNLDKV